MADSSMAAVPPDESPSVDRRPAGRRLRSLITLGLLAAAVGGAASANAPWWELQVARPDAGEPLTASFSGADSSAGLAILLVLAALAGILVLLATGRRGRRVMGVLLAMIFAAMLVLGVVAPQPTATEIESNLQTLSLDRDSQLLPTGFAWVYVLTAAFGLASAVALVVFAGRWPDRSARYQRTVGPLAADDPEGWWRAMDAGQDPTDQPTEISASDPDYPTPGETGQNDVQHRGGRR